MNDIVPAALAGGIVGVIVALFLSIASWLVFDGWAFWPLAKGAFFIGAVFGALQGYGESVRRKGGRRNQ